MKDYTIQLKKYWRINALTFIATFKKNDDKHGYFGHFIHPITLTKIKYPNLESKEVEDKRISFFSDNVDKLINGHFYKVELEHTDNPKGKNNPYFLKIKMIGELNQDVTQRHIEGEINKELLQNLLGATTLSKNQICKEHIQLRFERLNNPEANKIIANLMREIGKGMYSSKQRMIFELLQNADDAPGKEKVEFHIDVNGDYFFIMHDGVPFNKDDVDAITSAAESTKRKDKKKTGYKGIGFKSVFTDSEEVWLKSGGYQFAFIRNSVLFNDFESFYFSSKDYRDFPELIERHRQKYQKDILSYNSLTDIPWQVIPIWQDELPGEFSDSNFNNFDNPVQFALNVGKNNIYSEGGYLSAIDNIVKRPQFLLFLRNTSKFRSPKNRVTIIRTDDGEIIKIEKSTVEYIGTESIQKKAILEYTKQIYSSIQVNNKAFAELNIGIKKIVEKNDLNEDTYHFVDLDGNKIETIPPKLASTTETEISFGISLINNKISPEKEYTKGLPKYSSLFTYLPMEDTRFQLPFLVNADFVPSSDRQRIQGDNLWNKYIMIKVAEKHVATLVHFAQEFLEDKETNDSYLSLLLKNPLPEDDTAQQIINSYNETYLEQLENTEFVVNDNNQVQLLSDTIVDDSGLVELFGNEIFYEIIDTEKRLPHCDLDTGFLKEYEYLNVEVIDLEKLAYHITPDLCENLGNIIAQNSLYEKTELLIWLNRLVKYIPDNFAKIPFILHNNTLFSLEGLINEKDAWIINEHTSQYALLIKELGFHTIELNLDKYPNIKEYLHRLRDYLNDKTLTYERIASNSNIHKLPIASKLTLIDFFQKSVFMTGIGPTRYFGELELFLDEYDNPRPIWQLLSRNENLEVNSVNNFRIKHIEYNSLTEDLQKQLITKGKIFTSFILNQDLFQVWSQQFESKTINTYVGDLKTIYGWVENPDEISSAQWASIPWLYINDEVRFTTSDKVYWSKAFDGLSTDNFETIKSVLHNKEIKTLPVQKCGSLIKAFPIKTDDNNGINWSEIDELELLATNTLLDWMEVDGGFGDFFDNYTFVQNTNGSYKIEEIEDVQIFDGSNKDLKDYIHSKVELSSLFNELDKDLCSENRSKIGLLRGERLIRAILETGKYDQKLAMLLPTNLSMEDLDRFVANLSEFNLVSGQDYNSNTPEHIILSQLLKNIEDVDQIANEIQIVINNFREKVKIDQNPLSDYDLSDRVQFGKGDDKKVLKLSDIVKEYEGESDVLDKLIESFISINNRGKLRKLIFKTRQLMPYEVYQKIEAEASSFYSVSQVVFQLLYNKYVGKSQWKKNQFDDYWKAQKNDEQLQTSYKSFLDIILDLGFTELTGFYFHDLKLENCVDKSFAVDSELLPQWMEEWINLNKIERITFISKLGYNDIDSPIVKLRQSVIAKNYNQDTVTHNFVEAKSNNFLIWNTINWLSTFSSEIITKNIGLIRQINSLITLDKNNTNNIVIPIISSVNSDGSRSYILQNVAIKSNLYLLSDDEEFSHSVFNAIKSDDEMIPFIDGSCENKLIHFNTEKIQLNESIDSELLVSDSKLWEEPFYKKWKYYEDCPIYIYSGQEIPYKRTFKDIIINKFTSDLKVPFNGGYYFSNILKNAILSQKPSIIPKDKFESLKDWYIKLTMTLLFWKILLSNIMKLLIV